MKIKNLLFATLTCSLLLYSCKKEKSATLSENKQYISNNPKELHNLYEKTLKTTLVLLNNKEIKEFVIKECLKQKSGDYTVALKDIVTHFGAKSEFENSLKTLDGLITGIKKINGGTEPMIFYPKAETIEDNYLALNKANKTIKTLDVVPIENVTPIAVIQGELYPNYSTPGYSIDYTGQLVYVQDINEEFAWENDVFVIGSEEFNLVNTNAADHELFYSSPYPPTILGLRSNGHLEYAGLIQVTDMGAIEPWTSGKFEFKIRIVLSNGTVLYKDFDKVKRKYFRDQKWYDFNYFVASWNTSNIGNVMQEGWLEDDGGSTNETTYTFPVTPTQPYSFTVKVPSKTKDDDLGTTIVQFTDDLDQIYDLSHMKFKRK